MGEQFVEINFAEYGAQCGLSKLLRLPIIILDLHYCLRSADDAPVDHGIHLQRDVIASNNVLWRDFQRLLSQINSNHAVDGPENENDARALRVGQQPPEPEDDTALIFAENFDGADQVQAYDDE